MSKASKISLLAAFIALVGYAVTHVMFGGLNLDYLTLGAFAVAMATSVFFDRRLYVEFLGMRTTKHGMNMGAVIALMLVGVVCVNYLAVRHNKTWDLTQEKANSLSDQTTKVLDGLTEDLKIKLFYRGTQSAEAKQNAQPTLTMFKDYSGRVKIENINALVDEEQAIEFLKDQPDLRTAPILVFVEYKGKRIRVDEPVDESQLTAAIIRATRTADVAVYFVQGHGEHDLHGTDDAGLSELAKSLKEGSFKAETLNLVEHKDVPADAAVVMIAGPATAFLEGELETLRAYAKRGGNLIVAIDPGQRHNLANLTKPFGVEFLNNYVLSPRMQIQGAGPATIVGRAYDPSSEITRNLQSNSSLTVFPLVSELRAAGDKNSDKQIETHDLIKSDPSTVSVTDPRHAAGERPPPHASVLAMSAKGAAEGGKTFEMVVFGDSDFATNRGLYLGVNRDVIMNAFAKLTNQKDLLSIRPKLAKGTMLTLSAGSSWIIILASLGVPLGLLITALVIWFRRRGA